MRSEPSDRPAGGPFAFFLGGADLEMEAIAALLAKHAPGAAVHDRRLAWGARASDYEAELRVAEAAGQTPVLIELQPDLAGGPSWVWIDHHGGRSGADQPCALEQLVDLLGLPPSAWTRRLRLIAANDRGHVAEMRRVGATVEEMREVRRADRRAQGVTDQEEAAAEAAIELAEQRCGGRLTVVRLASPRDSPVVDRLDGLLGGPGFETLLVLTPKGPNVSGPGAVVSWLNERFPGGWSGGGLPAAGYWGREGGGEEVLTALTGYLSGRTPASGA